MRAASSPLFSAYNDLLQKLLLAMTSVLCRMDVHLEPNLPDIKKQICVMQQ